MNTPWGKLRMNPTRAAAIKAMCSSCMGWEEGKEAPVGLAREIRSCTVPLCPLYQFRPYKTPAEKKPYVGPPIGFARTQPTPE
jgi:hypothetical protein